MIVALGASAGGLEALKDFFRAVQPHAEVGYVVITHLPASHESHLDELIGREASIPVAAAHDGQAVEGGKVYVSVPGTLLGIADGRLSVAAAPARGVTPLPIDHFMTELAESAGEHSAGIVLSGTAHDGTAGLKAIRGAGGLALVQSPETAEFPGMPNSAITAGVADHVLPVQDMPAALLDFLRHAPEELAGPEDAAGAAPSVEDALMAVLRLVQVRTGHDFRWYRPAMLRRRLRRRMGLCKVDRVQDYIALLEASGDEIDTLKNEFLIGVTDFFRDPPAWEELAQGVIPALIAERLGDDAPIRVWTPGCATGEESYSIAMLLLEAAEGHIDPQRIQVFGTDIDLQALSVARAGAYPASIVSTVSAQRLARFFDRRGERYVARKSLRDAILFAPQNLVRDTPFSRLDIVLCRNLLIYFKPDLQQRVFELFHFALKPGGILLLGKAESIGTPTELFVPASRTIRLYRRTGTRAHLPRGFGHMQRGLLEDTPPGLQRPPSRHSAAAIVDAQLQGRAVTAAVLVDREGRALYFHGDTAPFLQLQGSASLELSALVQQALRVRVRSALRTALGEGAAASSHVNLKIGDQERRVHLAVEPVHVLDAHGLALAMFTLPAPLVVGRAPAEPRSPQEAGDLARQYEEARQELAAALEDAERSNEELRTANEESLALNEELQSSNEELESSKEELESLNEELTTVNAQLDEKVNELALRNDDLANLLASTGVATILLDAQWRVRRFTPAATEVFSLKAGDEGRLLSDISSRVPDPEFAAALERAATSRESSRAELRTAQGQTYLRRVLPYQTQAGKVDGAVVTFTDVTALRDAAQRTREFIAVLQDSNDAIIICDRDARILAWNDGARRLYGHVREDVVGARLYDLVPPAQRDGARQLLEQVLATGKGRTQESHRIRRDGSTVAVSITASALRDEAGEVYAVISTERDISEQLQSQSEVYFRRLADRIPVLLRVENVDGFAEFVNHPCTVFTGRDRKALMGEGWLQFVHPEDRARFQAEHATALAQRARLETDLRMRRADGVFRWMRSISVPHLDAADRFVGYIALMLDVHDHKVAESALRDADRRKDEFLAMLAHELRNPLAPIRNAVAIITRASQANPSISWAGDVIGRQTELLAKLLDDLLDVARIARGKVTLEKAPVELAVLVQRSVEICQPLIEARHHRLAVEVTDEPLVVEGDLARLTQVLSNLLTNAAKYMDEGGQIHLDVRRSGDTAVIRVRDTGIGMQPDMLAHVFEPFMQADSTLDRSRGGLGLGLTLVKQLVGLHGGTVQAFSAGLGQGSEFVISLPLVAGRVTRPHADEQAGVAASEDACRVLLVDDNRDGVESLAMLLRLAGHEVSLAYDGNEALAMAERCHPQVVVLDVGLPGLDGYQVARRLRGKASTAKARLIALTGYGQPDDIARARDAGFDHHFVKPVNPDVLLNLMSRPARETTGRSA